jgi:predicted transporter
MDRDLRSALLILGLFFVGCFVAMTISVAVSSHFDVLTVAALLIAVMLALPLIGALLNPPD